MKTTRTSSERYVRTDYQGLIDFLHQGLRSIVLRFYTDPQVSSYRLVSLQGIYGSHHFLGIAVMDQNFSIKLLGITGDCPALTLICNFVHHNGYCSCWLCFIRGIHVNHEQQYRHQQLVLRLPQRFSELSSEAEHTKKNVYGHFGELVIARLLDIPLPNAIKYGQQRGSNWTLTWIVNNSLVRHWCSPYCLDTFHRMFLLLYLFRLLQQKDTIKW